MVNPYQFYFNPHAPLLTKTNIDIFRTREYGQQNLRRSLHLMLGFYGLKYQQSPPKIILAESFSERKKVWVHWGNHNHLRITRILKCLRSLGLENEAILFLQCLEKIYQLLL